MTAPGPTSDAPPSWLPATFRALRHRNYRLFFIGQLVSLVGTFVQGTALSWLAHELTNQSTWTALVAAAQIVPGVILGPLGGSLADRFPKRRLIFITQATFAVLAVLLAVLVLTGEARPWHLLVVATATGVVNAIDLPARLAFIMEMVGREDLVNAVALNSLLFNSARAIGPAVSGLVLLVFSPGVCFLVNALSYFALLLALAAMRLPPHPPRPAGRAGPSWLAGFAYLGRHPTLALLVILAGVMALCGWPFLTLLPAQVTHHMTIDEPILGLLRSVQAGGTALGAPPQRPQALGFSLLVSATGVGALVSALAVATFGSLARRRAFIASGITLAVTGIIGLAWSTDILPAAGFCAVIGAGLILFFATTQSVVQLSAEDAVRGRVLGVWSMMISAGLPAGTLLAGSAADVWGVPRVLAAMGWACGTVALLMYGVHSMIKSKARSSAPEGG